MDDILAAVAEAVARHGVRTVVHSGVLDDIDDDGETAFVVIPHEYLRVAPRPSDELLGRTIGFGVEHPGTDSFELAAQANEVLPARFEISMEAATEMARRGMPAEYFELGYSPLWDMWGGTPADRPIDLVYMGTAEAERLQVLAGMADDLAGLNTELLIPPLEWRNQRRPDFIMGEPKWRLLARSKVTLNLHRQAKTTLEFVRTLEAMCNGCAVVTETSTELYGLEPGRHMLMAPRGDLGGMIRGALEDPERLRAMTAEAYRFCREELDMDSSAERLISVAEDILRRASGAPAPVRGRGIERVTELRRANWMPEPLPLPSRTVTFPEPLRSAVRALTEHRRGHMGLERSVTGAPSTADVDAIIVQDGSCGPLARTLDSLTAQGVPVNVHLAGLGMDEPRDISGLASFTRFTPETSIGAARNALWARCEAPFALVLNAGDELLDGALAAMLAALRESEDLVASYPMAAYGEVSIVNLSLPELFRLERFAYLTRGYLVRRSALASRRPWADDPAIDAYVDHEFWVGLAQHAVEVSHLHRIGVRLWPVDPAKLSPTDPAELHEVLAERRRRQERRSGRQTLGTAGNGRPLVSVVMPAFNTSRFIGSALDSALEQECVGGAVEIIVVDDGSTDDTPGVLAAYGPRIRVIRQENQGLARAVETGLRVAQGAYIALLDADDEWPADRLSRYLHAFDADPEIALLHGDMQVIDAGGAVVSRSFFAHSSITPHDGRPLGQLLSENFVTESALMFHSSLLPAILPMPEVAPYPDWWIAVCAASVGRIERVHGIGSRYRIHGNNMNLGATDPLAASRIARRELRWRTWLMVNFATDPLVEPQHMIKASDALDHALTVTERPAPTGVRALLPADPEAARAVAATVSADEPPLDRSRGLLHARGLDPFDGAIRLDLLIAARAAAVGASHEARPPLSQISELSGPMICWLDELMRCPELLDGFREHVERGLTTALLILAPDSADLSWLQATVAADDLLSGELCKLVVIDEPSTIPARRWLAGRAGSLLTRVEPRSDFETVPIVDHATIPRVNATT